MKYVFAIIFLVLNFCFKAKRSPFDTRTPSGAALNYLSSLKMPPNLTGAPIQLPFNRIRFVAKGNILTYQIPNSENFTDFTLTPAPPSGISLDPLTGLVTCTCFVNSSFFRNPFVLSYKSKSTGEVFTTEFFLEVFSPNVLIVPSNGLFNMNDKQHNSYGIVYNNSLYVSFVDGNDSSKLKLARWIGLSEQSWEIVGVSSVTNVTNDKQINTIHNGKIYILYYDSSYNFHLDSYDQNGYTNIESLNETEFLNPSMISYEGNLYIVFDDNDNYGYIKTCVNSLSNCNIDYTTNASGATLSLHSWNASLYLAFGEYMNILRLFKLENGNWQSFMNISLSNNVTQTHFTTYKNQLYVGWRGAISPDFNVYLARIEGNSSVSLNSGNNISSNTDNNRFSVLGTEERLYIVFSSSPEITYRSYDGTSFSSFSNNLKEWNVPNLPQIFFWNDLPILLWEENADTMQRIYLKVLE